MAEEKSSKFVIFQFPNKPMWVLAAAWLVSYFSSGLISSVSRTVFYIAGIIWAYEEITDGVNLFRRILGLAALLAIGYLMLKATR
jgi:hypothetical protein